MSIIHLGVVSGEQTYTLPNTNFTFTASSVAEGISMSLQLARDPGAACARLAEQLQAYGNDMREMLQDYLKDLIASLGNLGRGVNVDAVRDCIRRINRGEDVSKCDDAVANLVAEGSKVFNEGGFDIGGAIDVVIGTFANWGFDKIMSAVTAALTKNLGLVDRVMDKLLAKINCTAGEVTAPQTASRNEPLRVSPTTTPKLAPEALAVLQWYGTAAQEWQEKNPPKSPKPKPKPKAPAPKPSRTQPVQTAPETATEKSSFVPWILAGVGVGVASYLLLRYR